MKKFLITTAIPYVNAKPHIGHALEFVQTDVIARSQRLRHREVVFLTGSDENALKNVQAAEKSGVEVESFCKHNAETFSQMMQVLQVQYDVFQRSSSPQHHQASQLLWEKCKASGDIYQKEYEGLYCVGCETFYTVDELNEQGECVEHPGKPLEKVKENNYFFRLSKYATRIADLIEKKEIQIVPEKREKEIVNFLKGDVQDISISRSVERARGWGVPVPHDVSQIMYVWFDALNVYQSGVGFGNNELQYTSSWPADVHVIGKGILRFHAVYWPAILLSAHLELPKKICVHGYFTVNGQKMSKTIGNVVDPFNVVEKFGTDSVRYYLLREMSTSEDGDFSIERLREVRNTILANDLGNLASRCASLSRTEVFTVIAPTQISTTVASYIDQFKLKEAMDEIWERVQTLNTKITQEKPWTLSSGKAKYMEEVIQEFVQIAFDLQPFLPETGEKILSYFLQNKKEDFAPLFPKIHQ
ncbi:MAG: Methionine-tRNA ligase [Microgenomates group bacterium GW2011_GWF2_45_18]|nr:MAG: Methionine-tRNA ligase [Microgenomates group bacterium GW2011_GWF1_44_10]KKU02041.1 MAG: Methionine-tRNA ligase [Microgenomates group bacterium GW2011_GWF2_45_18]OGJ41538.1 MAG: methionine--tRNA ligase [Candidatus Pacebacteria bacterium RIFOXYB1_FULL_44_10]HAU99303.1 methionine--tRNA ligase [Candidatus Paceibacterota bacterium]HAX01514.1 methionine--tRNA ligase [Candidatus Paceibacterota bacterium]